MSVTDVVMISSPGAGSTAATATWTAALPEAQAMTCCTPSISASAASSALVWAPFVAVSTPLWMTSVNAAISSGPKDRPLASWSDGNRIWVTSFLWSFGASQAARMDGGTSPRGRVGRAPR